MQHTLSKYETSVPLLNFLRGWSMALCIFLAYTCLFNFSLGYSAPLTEVLCLVVLVALLSWKEVVMVSDGEITTWYQHQLLPFVKGPASTTEICNFMKLETKPASFGYVNWLAVGEHETLNLFSTGKLS